MQADRHAGPFRFRRGDGQPPALRRGAWNSATTPSQPASRDSFSLSS
jgi:hypothetical protein